MLRLSLALLVASAIGGAGCGVSKDDRPYDLEYVTAAVFAPSCGSTQCHSQFRGANGVVLDTPEHVRETIVRKGLVRFDGPENYNPSNPADSTLYHWVTDIDPLGAGIGRMPFDQPLPNKDITLLYTWMLDPDYAPDHDGGRARGAQCNPAEFEGRACDDKRVVECTDDWSFGSTVYECRLGCNREPGASDELEAKWCYSDCGDGVVDGGEQCDDKNRDPADGCDNSCQVTP